MEQNHHIIMGSVLIYHQANVEKIMP